MLKTMLLLLLAFVSAILTSTGFCADTIEASKQQPPNQLVRVDRRNPSVPVLSTRRYFKPTLGRLGYKSVLTSTGMPNGGG
jgi:hypothetical protein